MEKRERRFAKAESPLIVERLSRWEQLEEIRPALEKMLESSAPEVGAFSTFEFLQAWWAAYGNDNGRELFFLACRVPGGDIVAVAPLFREKELRRWVLRLVGDTSDDVDGFDLLACKGFESDAVAAWGRWLAAKRSEWSSLQLNSVPTGSRLLAEFRSVCRSHGFASREVTISHRVIQLPSDWEQYRRQLSSKMRFSISHQMRAAEQKWHPSLHLCQSEAEALEWLGLLAEWQGVRWSSRGIDGKFRWDRRRLFYEKLVVGLVRTGDLRFWALVANEQVLALELGCRFRGHYIGIHPAFDPALASYSPGVVLRAMILQHLMREGMELYDFGAGDEEYKRRWANERRTFSNLCCAPLWTSAGLRVRLDNVVDGTRKKIKWLLSRAGYARVSATR
jgi:CelD/BcsL family acetyltransferase involved in cellulose biosynthesis